MGEFWIINITKLNISLADLNVTIKPYSSINLLDIKHYSLTKDQLDKSLKSGSLYNKRDKVKLRNGSPKVNKINLVMSKDIMPTRERSLYNIKEEYYEELNLDDDKYMEESVEEEPSK